METKGIPDACVGCALSSRRDFFKETFGVAAVVLAALGAPIPVAGLATSEILGERRGRTVSYPVPAADGAQIDRANQVILVRWQGAAYAFALSCPHENQALRWYPNDGRFQCPKHKSRYTPDGAFVSGRATRGMDRFDVRVEGGEVVVDLAVLHDQTADPSAWAEAKVSLG